MSTSAIYSRGLNSKEGDSHRTAVPSSPLWVLVWCYMLSHDLAFVCLYSRRQSLSGVVSPLVLPFFEVFGLPARNCGRPQSI